MHIEEAVMLHQVLREITQSNAGRNGQVERSFEGDSHKVMHVGVVGEKEILMKIK